MQPIHQTVSEEDESTTDRLKKEVSKLKEKLSIVEIEVSALFYFSVVLNNLTM